MMALVLVVSRQVDKSKGIRGISFCAKVVQCVPKRVLATYLTSRGVPALFKILTTNCTPFTFSNDRSELGASTSIHNNVSSTMDERCG